MQYKLIHNAYTIDINGNHKYRTNNKLPPPFFFAAVMNVNKTACHKEAGPKNNALLCINTLDAFQW